MFKIKYCLSTRYIHYIIVALDTLKFGWKT